MSVFINRRNAWISCFATILLLAFSPTLSLAIPATTTDVVASRRHDLDEQKSSIDRLRGTVEKKRADLQKLRDAGDAVAVDAALLEETRLEKEAGEIELQSTELDLLETAHTQNDLATAIEQLQDKLKSLRAGTLQNAERVLAGKIEQQLAEKHNLLALEREQQTLWNQRGQLIKEKLQLVKEYWSLLNERYAAIQSNQREAALIELEKHLKLESDRLLSLSTALHEKLGTVTGSTPDAEAGKSLLLTQIKEADESSYLLKVQLQAEKAAYSLNQLAGMLRGKDLAAPRLASIVEEVDGINQELNAALNLTQGKSDVLRQLLAVKQKRQSNKAAIQQKLRREQQIVGDLIEQFARQVSTLQQLTKQAGKVAETAHQIYQETLKRSLTARHKLPGEFFEWKALLHETLLLPQTLLKTAQEVAIQYWRAMTQSDAAHLFALLALTASWLWCWRQIARLPTLQAAADLQHGAGFSATALTVALALLRDNRLSLSFCLLSLTAGWMVDVDARAFTLLSLSFALWFGGRLPLGLAYWLLLSPLVARAEWKQNLYRVYQWFIVLSVLLALYLMLGHLDIITDELLALAERAFMLFIACAFLAALHLRPRVLAWLKRVAPSRWYKIARLASFLFLAFMLGAASLGVAGYVNLAWAMAGHLAWLLLVVVGWYIVRGVLHDLCNSLKNQALSYSDRGVLWAQDVIDPLHQLLRLLLAVVAAVCLFQIYGWDAESPVLQAVGRAMTRPWFHIGEQSFDVQRMLFTGLFVFLLFATTRWIRKFSFRWIYAGVSDIGVQNSLAAFTQYGLFLLGVLILLKTLGLDLTSLAIFTGAVGVGIGLGLQSIANNFISGIILLLERPLKTKDLVTVAGIEGEVSDIGIRSVTVRTY
ncbi:MAG: mechanosensitive ion channel, partial [Methylococcaceae bacterium]